MDKEAADTPAGTFEFEVDSKGALYEAGFERDEFSRKWVEDHYPVNLSISNLKVVTRCDVHRIEYHDENFNLTKFPNRFKPWPSCSMYIVGTVDDNEERNFYRLNFDQDRDGFASAVHVRGQIHVEIFADDSSKEDEDDSKNLYLGQALLPGADAASGEEAQCSIRLTIPEDHLVSLVESIDTHAETTIDLRLHIHCRHREHDGRVRNVSATRIPDSSILLLEECTCLIEWISAVSSVGK